MVTQVVIEQFYENLEEATVGRWLKSEGDTVNAGEALVEIITDKVTFEMEAPASGVLRRVVAPEKSVVPVGFVIALLAEGQELLPDVTAHNVSVLERRRRMVEEAASSLKTVATPSPGELETTGEHSSTVAQGIRDRGKVRATPAARRVAREKGVDLAQVAQQLGGGVIREEDVLRWVEKQ